jgi:hypothetical protein
MLAAAVLVALGGAVAFAFVPSSVLAGPAPDGGDPHDEREPCHHCGVAGPPLVVSAGRGSPPGGSGGAHLS